jgi:F-type H+-transporting ATPase subunit b
MLLIAAAHAAEAAGSAPQPGFFAEPENWVAITFLLMVVVLARPLGRAIAGQLDARRDAIKARLDEAARLHAEAETLLATHQQRLRDAQRDAENMLSTARGEAERLTAAGKRDLEELLKRREQQAVGRIAMAEADALREVRAVAVDLAIEAARKIIAENMTPELAAALTERSIKDLGDRLH